MFVSMFCNAQNIDFSDYWTWQPPSGGYYNINLNTIEAPCDQFVYMTGNNHFGIFVELPQENPDGLYFDFWMVFHVTSSTLIEFLPEYIDGANNGYFNLETYYFDIVDCPCNEVSNNSDYNFELESYYWTNLAPIESEFILVNITAARTIDRVRIKHNSFPVVQLECDDTHIQEEIYSELEWQDDESINVNTNTISCESALSICGEGSLSADFSNTFLDQPTQFWYKIKNNGNGVPQLQYYLQSGSNSNAQGNNFIINSAEIYGPFNECDEVNCSQLPSPNLQYVNSQNWNSSPSFFNYEGSYLVKINLTLNGNPASLNLNYSNTNCNFSIPPPPPCEACIPEMLVGDKKYVVSCWVHEESWTPGTTNFENITMNVTFAQGTGTPVTISPTGAIIDGWQRMEGVVEISSTDAQVDISFVPTGGTVYVDDIRFFPYDGSMKSYVYDPETLWFVAELDERNYATFYEYDEEGKLARIKKETEKGIMTIQESRNSNVKQ